MTDFVGPRLKYCRRGHAMVGDNVSYHPYARCKTCKNARTRQRYYTDDQYHWAERKKALVRMQLISMCKELAYALDCYYDPEGARFPLRKSFDPVKYNDRDNKRAREGRERRKQARILADSLDVIHGPLTFVTPIRLAA